MKKTAQRCFRQAESLLLTCVDNLSNGEANKRTSIKDDSPPPFFLSDICEAETGLSLVDDEALMNHIRSIPLARLPESVVFICQIVSPTLAKVDRLFDRVSPLLRHWMHLRDVRLA
jgi:hypothetical protein